MKSRIWFLKSDGVEVLVITKSRITEVTVLVTQCLNGGTTGFMQSFEILEKFWNFEGVLQQQKSIEKWI